MSIRIWNWVFVAFVGIMDRYNASCQDSTIFYSFVNYPTATRDSVRGFSFGDLLWWNRGAFNLPYVGFDENKREYWISLQDKVGEFAKRQEKMHFRSSMTVRNLRMHPDEFMQLKSGKRQKHLRRSQRIISNFSINEFREDFNILVQSWEKEPMFQYSLILNEGLMRLNKYLSFAYQLDYTILEVLYDFTGYDKYSDFEQRLQVVIEEDQPFLLLTENGYHQDIAIRRLKDLLTKGLPTN